MCVSVRRERGKEGGREREGSRGREERDRESRVEKTIIIEEEVKNWRAECQETLKELERGERVNICKYSVVGSVKRNETNKWKTF